jgi:beta-phosphoglucomutase-like phosphatase (HAD superfamily)
MDAIIFDFDGVIVDSEGLHEAGFREVLGPEGIELDSQVYRSRYLGYSDVDALKAIYRDEGKTLNDKKMHELISAKALRVARWFQQGLCEGEGAGDLVREAAGKVPLAVCSGALREEVVQGLGQLKLSEFFSAIVAAEDVRAGKPDPQGYLLALEKLSQATRRPLRASRTLVIEDAPWGIVAGQAAGMKVLAVCTSYPPEQLGQADRVVATPADVDLGQLEGML